MPFRAELSSAKSPAPRLHPNLAEPYRKRISELTLIASRYDSLQAREVVRGLVEEILLIPEDGRTHAAEAAG